VCVYCVFNLFGLCLWGVSLCVCGRDWCWIVGSEFVLCVVEFDVGV